MFRQFLLEPFAESGNSVKGAVEDDGLAIRAFERHGHGTGYKSLLEVLLGLFVFEADDLIPGKDKLLVSSNLY